MSFLRRAAASFKSYAACQGGTIALMYALAAVPMFAAAGSAVDWSRNSTARANLSSALDAATLAAASAENLTSAQRIKIAEAMFMANVDPELGAKVSFKIKDGFVEAEVDADLPTTFMKLVGFDDMQINIENKVNLTDRKKAEIALVLDFSGSMNDAISGGGAKYKVMKKAVNGLLTELKGLKKGTAKVGLVPFSHQVYGSMAGDFVVGGKANTVWTGCTVDRLHPYNTNASTPNVKDDATKWGQAQAPSNHGTSCKPYRDKGLIMQPVTDKLDNISNSINAMTPYAYTHIALGVEFGYHMLTPNKPFGEDLTKLNDKDTVKYLVVLTDGMQTEPGYGPRGKQTIENAEANLADLCQNAKNDGIVVVTVAFDLDDSDTRKRLQKCASAGEENFHVADSGSDLNKAFATITTQIAQNIFLSK